MSINSPLAERHAEAGATFSDFAGWSMPLQYEGSVAEHQAVRNGVGVFDVSHLGKCRIVGPGAVEFANRCFTNDLGKVGPGKAQYTMLCAEDGGVIDDLIAYIISPDEVFCIPNAANTATVVARLKELAPDGIEITNLHHDYAVLAVQGPKSTEVLKAMDLPTEHKYMSFAVCEQDGVPFTVCRTGYTGEHGYELVVPSEVAAAVWDRVMQAGEPHEIRPCGLAARDSLRTEMCYSLHGHEISPEIDPVTAGLSWAIGWAKNEFEGASALREIKDAGPRRRLRALKAVGRGIPRPGMAVVDAEGAEIGTVTSGTYSPSLQCGIALALVPTQIKLGDQVGIQIRTKVEQFVIVKPPFIDTEVR